MPLMPRSDLDTHEVFNQPAPRDALPLWGIDAPLRAAVARTAPAHAPAIEAFAAEIGCAEAVEDGRLANRFVPELVTFDLSGRRLDEVKFHPAYHAMMRRGFAAGYSALPWTAAEGSHAAHAAMVYLLTQIEPGVCCPMTMTYAAISSAHGGV